MCLVVVGQMSFLRFRFSEQILKAKVTFLLFTFVAYLYLGSSSPKAKTIQLQVSGDKVNTSANLPMPPLTSFFFSLSHSKLIQVLLLK